MIVQCDNTKGGTKRNTQQKHTSLETCVLKLRHHIQALTDIFLYFYIQFKYQDFVYLFIFYYFYLALPSLVLFFFYFVVIMLKKMEQENF